MQGTQEMWVWSLGQEDPLEKEMATHSSIPTWKIPWTEEPGSYSPGGHKQSDTTEWLSRDMCSKVEDFIHQDPCVQLPGMWEEKFPEQGQSMSSRGAVGEKLRLEEQPRSQSALCVGESLWGLGFGKSGGEQRKPVCNR